VYKRQAHDGVTVSGTPRRLVVQVEALAPRQTDAEQIIKGPSADRAYNSDGTPSKAAEGFARKNGVDPAELVVADVDGGRYVTARVRQLGRPAGEVLAEALHGAIAGIRFAKSMRWNETGITFSRPIRWLLALHGAAVLRFSYAGVESSGYTRGLRPYGSPLYPVASADAYAQALARDGIVLDIAARRAGIWDQVTRLAVSTGGRILPDERLLDEITQLVESPVALLGRFEEKYLALPREVLVTVMRDKQRYFAVEGQDGRLMAYFVAVRNGDDRHLEKVTHGNEQVLRARFSDADYFYSQDTRKTLADFLPRLDTLTFQEKLGSMLDKNRRIQSLVDPLSDLLSLDSADRAVAHAAAGLLKADLATQVVVEMTSLQGTMGRVYALRAGQPQAVADAISEHWLPRGADDAPPTSRAGQLLALTDRLDSLVGLFAAGLEPRSTADPYGLRRAALGVIRIAVEGELDLDLTEAIARIAAVQPISVSDETQHAVLHFIAGRLRGWIEEQGWRTDVVSAVLAEQAANPFRALRGVQQLSAWVTRPDWEPILDGFARCVRITRAETETYPVDPALFTQSEEHALYAAWQSAHAAIPADADVHTFLTAFTAMLPAITAYFGTGKGDGVLVNAPEPDTRRNRIGLLQAISALQRRRADLSFLSGF
jgi:glycyl-tRNA synthetase